MKWEPNQTIAKEQLGKQKQIKENDHVSITPVNSVIEPVTMFALETPFALLVRVIAIITLK